MPKKRIVVALGRNAFGKTLPEQKTAVKEAAKAIADLAELKYQIVITHSNGPQVGMIHMAMTEFGNAHQDFTVAPMAVCSAMSQGYIRSYVSLLRNEPGLHWIRPSERDPY